MKQLFLKITSLFVMAFMLFGCASTTPVITPTADPKTLRIVAASEVKLLEDAGVFADFTKQTGIAVSTRYLGSVEVKLKVQAYTQANPGDVDVFWAASPIWLPGSLVTDKTSVMRTYVVLAVDPALATELGWSTTSGITVNDIIAAINAGRLKLAMPSASQDDAGANFYLALWQATGGDTEALRTILSAVSRTASNVADLKTAFVSDRVSASGNYNAIVLPESMVIATNQELVAKNATPLTVYYVQNAVGMQNYQLGWVKGASEEKQEQFKLLAQYLTSDEMRARLQELGFRTGRVGMRVENPDPAVFNPAWGIDTQTEFGLIELPKDTVIAQALDLYQTELRKPSFTVYCLDFSGSMANDNRRDQLVSAMDILLDQLKATQYKLQATNGDTTYVMTFAKVVLAQWQVIGNDPQQLAGLNANVKGQAFPEDQATSGTNVYGCAQQAIDVVSTNLESGQLPAVILMTDGEHNTNGYSYETFTQHYTAMSSSVPVYTIIFGDASQQAMQQLADFTHGAVCDGRGGEEALARCFRIFKGNN